MIDDNVVISFKPKAVNIIYDAEDSQFYFFILGLSLLNSQYIYFVTYLKISIECVIKNFKFNMSEQNYWPSPPQNLSLSQSFTFQQMMTHPTHCQGEKPWSRLDALFLVSRPTVFDHFLHHSYQVPSHRNFSRRLL